jgi:glycosyltransferase involved in cell wall biosynthesis
LNEEKHLPGCLAALKWCDDIVVVDSFSSDRSSEICLRAGARFVQHKFEGFGSQRNWALENIVFKHDWLLILDADEKVPPELATELRAVALQAPETVGAYRVRRKFYMWGRWLRYSSLYPTWVVRFIHKNKVRYVNRGHAETQEVQGDVVDLHNDLIDENVKGIDEWFERQNRYSTREAEYELSTEKEPVAVRSLWGADPLLRRALLKRISWRMPLRPIVYFFYSYILRRGFLDGYDGFIFCIMKSTFHAMIVAKKHELGRTQANLGPSGQERDVVPTSFA